MRILVAGAGGFLGGHLVKALIELGGKRGYRYGSVYIGKENGKHKRLAAHRVSWMIYRGNIPNGLNVLHKCDNPLCVNPKHLFLGTQTENVADMDAKGRRSNQTGNAGERSPLAKLTERDVMEIRKQWPAKSQSQLGRKYGVHQAHISLIVNGKSWKYMGLENCVLESCVVEGMKL